MSTETKVTPWSDENARNKFVPCAIGDHSDCPVTRKLKAGIGCDCACHSLLTEAVSVMREHDSDGWSDPIVAKIEAAL